MTGDSHVCVYPLRDLSPRRAGSVRLDARAQCASRTARRAESREAGALRVRRRADPAPQRAAAFGQVLRDRDLHLTVRSGNRTAVHLGRICRSAGARGGVAAVVSLLHGRAGARLRVPLEGRSPRMAMMEYMTTKKDELVGWIRKFSIFPYPFVTACCGMEFMSVSSTLYDTDRFGAARSEERRVA